MAKVLRTYYRNYNASDTTSTTIDAAQDPTASIEETGWEAPTGYIFSEWNPHRDGSGAAYQVGEITPYESLYAIWVKIPVPYLTTDTDLIAVADTIREKGGTNEALAWPTGYVNAIGAISGSTGPVLNLQGIAKWKQAGTSNSYQYEFGELGTPDIVMINHGLYSTGTTSWQGWISNIATSSYESSLITPKEYIGSTSGYSIYKGAGVKSSYNDTTISLTEEGLLTVANTNVTPGSNMGLSVAIAFVWTSLTPIEFYNQFSLPNNYWFDTKIIGDTTTTAFIIDFVSSIYTYAPCYLRGTLISLANGSQKPVEEITYNDELLVWDFDKGHLSTAKPLWIKRPQQKIGYHHLTLESGKTLDVVGTSGKAHRLLDIDAEKFIWSTDMVGHRTMTIDGEDRLVSCEWREELCEYYNIVTKRHINLYANDILTSCRYNNIYPIRGMCFVKEPRKVIPFEAYDVPREWYDGMRLSEQTIPIKDTNEYVRWRINHSI